MINAFSVENLLPEISSGKPRPHRGHDDITKTSLSQRIVQCFKSRISKYYKVSIKLNMLFMVYLYTGWSFNLVPSLYGMAVLLHAKVTTLQFIFKNSHYLGSN